MAELDSLFPQFFPKTWCDEFGVYGIDFVEGVSIGFVIKEAGGYAYLLAEEFEQIGKSAADLLALTLANLSLLGEASVGLAHPADSTVAWIESDDNFSSIRMLVPKVTAMLIEKLGPGFLFTIASRDLCFFWSAGSPHSLFEKHAAEAKEDFEDEEYNLSPGVFVFSDEWPCKSFALAS